MKVCFSLTATSTRPNGDKLRSHWWTTGPNINLTSHFFEYIFFWFPYTHLYVLTRATHGKSLPVLPNLNYIFSDKSEGSVSHGFEIWSLETCSLSDELIKEFKNKEKRCKTNCLHGRSIGGVDAAWDLSHLFSCLTFNLFLWCSIDVIPLKSKLRFCLSLFHRLKASYWTVLGEQ